MNNPMYFRNQYVITNSNASFPFPEWKQISFENNISIYHHPALETAHHMSGRCETAVIGFILDADNPRYSNSDILNDLSSHNTFDSFLKSTYRYGGRYCLLYKNCEGEYIVSDSLGLREIYFTFKGENFICASQPKLINLCSSQRLNDDPNYWAFVSSREFEKNEKAMIGDETPYKNVFHLMPNHYLDLIKQLPIRYFPVDEITPHDYVEECISFSTHKLKGFFESAFRRYNLIVPFTAGWDSRVTVAVSRGMHDRVKYFVNHYPYFTEKTPDLWVPRKISQQQGLNFTAVDVSPNEIVPEDFRKAFEESYDLPVIKFLGGHYAIYKTFGTIMSVLTVGSEVSRTIRHYRFRASLNANSRQLARMCDYPNSPYVINQCQRWMDEVWTSLAASKMQMMDLLFWESRVGNWGAQGFTMGDTYRETVSLFNCRELLVNMLSLHEKYRQYENRLYRGIIASTWKALLREPINPPMTFKSRVLKLSLQVGIYQKLKQIKYAVNST
jgi:hypothetical protein